MNAALKLSDKKRPLSIPTMYDRAMQALYALSLSPVAEATADPCSFGFRKYRSAQDACQYAFICLSHKNSAQWVLEGDIKGCFDNINHEWLLDNIPMDKSILKQFLKAWFAYNRHLNPTKAGTPQGEFCEVCRWFLYRKGYEMLERYEGKLSRTVLSSALWVLMLCLSIV